GDNSREPVRSYLCAAWLRVVSFMKWRSKSLIKFQAASYSLIFASLYSVSGQSSPSPRTGHNAAWDLARGELVVFGGSVGSLPGLLPTDQTWVWNGTWTLKNPVNRPSARTYANMVYDGARQQVVLFGGWDGTTAFNDTWVWDGNEWSERFPTNPPSPRYFHGMAYDATRQEIVLFGGFDSTSHFDDTWVWSGTNWLRRNPVMSPSPRGIRQGMAYDGQEVILFSGEDFGGVAANDTWAWNGTNWNAWNPTTAPLNRYGHALAYDEVRKRITLFGGLGLNDTWVWDGANWAEQTPQQIPPGRLGQTLTFIPTRGALFLFGGDDEFP